ncbi:MAG: 4a-hydroxytetrahydrobiopterin dehydratase [Acidimicrobiia bacterium]
MALVDDKDVAEFLEKSEHWKRDADSLVAEFKFKDFSQAVGFVSRVALAAEKADHHPDIDIRWNKVHLVLSTHSEGGLTEKDLDLADRISGFA